MILKFLGYFLATAGGVLGIPPALMLTEKKEKESINSGRIILFTALSAVIFFSIMVNGFMVNYCERLLLF